MKKQPNNQPRPNGKTLVQYRNCVPAKVVMQKQVGKRVLYKLRWSNLPYSTNSYGQTKYFEKWVNSNYCKVIEIPKQRHFLIETFYYLIKYFSKNEKK